MSQNGQGLVVNRLLRLSLVSTERVIGMIGLNAVLRRANLECFVSNLPPLNSEPSITLDDFARLNQVVEEFFGRASATILAQIGEAIFDQLAHDEWLSAGLAPTPGEPALTPRILYAFAGLANHINPAWQVDLVEQPDRYVWTMRACPVCAGRTSETPVCHVYIGLLRGALRSAGYLPRVEETQCIAMGAPACQFELSKVTRAILAVLPNPGAFLAPAPTHQLVG